MAADPATFPYKGSCLVSTLKLVETVTKNINTAVTNSFNVLAQGFRQGSLSNRQSDW
jgi:hypothetical protein